jgi:hypothetical protein
MPAVFKAVPGCNLVVTTRGCCAEKVVSLAAIGGYQFREAKPLISDGSD